MSLDDMVAARVAERTLELQRRLAECERKEEALRESEERYRSLVEESPDVIGIFQEGRLVFVNSTGAQKVGAKDKSELLGRRSEEFIHPDDLPAATARLQRRLAGATGVYPAEVRYIRLDGTTLPVEVSAAPTVFRGEVAVQFIARDITERKRAEEALRQSEIELRGILDTTADGILAVDSHGKMIRANRQFTKLWRIPPSLMDTGNDQQLLDFVLDQLSEPEAFLQKVHALYGSVEEDADTLTFKDGRIFERHSAPLSKEGSLVGRVWSFRDITQRKQAQAALQRSEALYHSLVDNIPQCILRKDREGRFTFANKSFCRLLGKPAEDVVGKTDFDLYSARLATKYQNDDQRAIETGASFETEEENILPSGEKRYVHVTKIPITGPASEIVGVQCVFQDITERKRAEEQIRKLSRAVEQSPASIVITDLAGRIEYVNPKFTQVTGYSFEEVRGQNSRLLKGNKTSPEEYRRLWQTISQGGEWRGEFHNRKKTGDLYWESASISPIVDTEGHITHFLAVKEDITERKVLEEQLRQAQKLDSIGRLAGGVAHDFNNMVQVILGNVDLALEEVKPGSALRESLEEIQKAGRRSADLTQQLLAFARKQTIAPRVLDLNETVEALLKMLRRLIGEDINLAWVPAPHLERVKVDPTQIHQILANLCVNARDAISGVGKISIETGNAVFEERDRAVHPEVVPGKYVRLVVSDEGCGMDKETLAHLFEPFFTTKGVGKGTGLGLAMVYGIVEQNHGFIQVESDRGKGTTVMVYLPQHVDQAPTTRKEAAAEVPKSRGEAVLLVEDEQAIVAIARRVLERLGYTVLTASTPSEAIRLAEAQAPTIQLLMTDVVMPEMNGRDLARRLLSSCPNLKCLFMSGYPADIIAQHGVLDEGLHFISKPFSMEDLAAKVREALERE